MGLAAFDLAAGRASVLKLARSVDGRTALEDQLIPGFIQV
jgi:hypothetical protein